MASELKKIELKNVSASKLRMYLQCPRRYYYAYGEGIFQEENLSTRFGSYIHAVLEDYVKALVLAGNEYDLKLLYAASTGRKKEFNEIPETGDLSFFDADVFLNRFASRKINPEHVYSIEKGFDIPFFDKDRIHITGRIDRIDTENPEEGDTILHIIDYKTGRNELDEKQLQDDIQMKLYITGAYLLYRKHHKKLRFSLNYLRDGSTVTYETSEPGSFFEEITGLIKQLERDDTYEKKPGKLCKYCPAFSVCKPFIKTLIKK